MTRRPAVPTAYCPPCGRCFLSVEAFDQHRVRGHCADPILRGLVPFRLGVVWGLPDEAETPSDALSPAVRPDDPGPTPNGRLRGTPPRESLSERNHHP